MPWLARACRRQALPIPFVADHTETSVSGCQCRSRRASLNPPFRSRMGWPFCQIETAAPSSPCLLKFSRKRGSRSWRSSSPCNCTRQSKQAEPNSKTLSQRETAGLDKFLQFLQIRIFFRELAKGRVHSETGFEIDARIFDVAEQRFVTAHIIIVDRFLQQRGWSFEQKLFCFRCL